MNNINLKPSAQKRFLIQIDHTKADAEAIMDYNKMAFLSDVMISVIDKLKNTTEYKHSLKMHCNGALKECEKTLEKHYNAYEQYGDVENDGKPIHSLNIHHITAKAYEEAFAFFTESPASEVASFMELVRRAKAKGFNLTDINIEFTPAQL